MNYFNENSICTIFEQKDDIQIQLNNQFIYEPEYFLEIRNHHEEQSQLNACNSLLQFSSHQFLDSRINQTHIDGFNENIDQDNQKVFSLTQFQEINNLNFNNEQHYFKNFSKDNQHPETQDDFNIQNHIINSQQNHQSNIQFQTKNQNSKNEINEKSLNINFDKAQPKKQLLNDKKRFKNQNFLKDILNSFHRYMKQLKYFPCKESENINLCEIKKKFNRYMKTHSFNNSVIKYVLTHKYYKLLFAQYYEDGSLENWVNKSKVNNKDILKNWVNYLVQCIQNPTLLDQLTINQLDAKKIVMEKF
ncbi:hypothetical protein ABPG72_018693 [Tetrahymena utriculariae]